MSLNLNTVALTYFQKLFVNEDKGKVLLVDKHTTPVISMCFTQTQLLQHDVILVEQIENLNKLNVMKNLNCVVYIRPTPELISFLCQELANPHYGASYRVFFSNVVSKPQLEKVAKADEYEVVKLVTELFQDYQEVNDNMFIIGDSDSTVEESNHVISVLLGLRQCPVIKFATLLIELRRLALEVVYNINSNSNNNLFDDLNLGLDRPPVLLLVDRKSDPITPLLLPWTYQLMIHEYIGINKNIVAVLGEHFPLSQHHDKFFSELMYLNYGDLTEKFQRYVEDYKLQTKVTLIESLKTQLLSDLKKLLAKFPEFKKLLGNIVKHLALIGELDRQIQVQDMWEIGELQQTIVGDLSTQSQIRLQVERTLENPNVLTVSKIKLLLLYQARFHDDGDIPPFIQRLQNTQFTPEPPTHSQVSLIRKFDTLFPASMPQPPQQEQGGLTNLFTNKKLTFNSFFAARDVRTDNIYMQYVPKLQKVLGELILPQQKSGDYLTVIPDKVEAKYGKHAGQLAGEVQNIIIYIRGGITYEEARLVHELNALNQGLNIVIGGDRVLNSNQWLEQLYDMVHMNQARESADVDRQAALRDIL